KSEAHLSSHHEPWSGPRWLRSTAVARPIPEDRPVNTFVRSVRLSGLTMGQRVILSPNKASRSVTVLHCCSWAPETSTWSSWSATAMKVRAAIESHHSISLRDSWPAILPGSISRACSRVRRNSEAVISLCFLFIFCCCSVRELKRGGLSSTLLAAGLLRSRVAGAALTQVRLHIGTSLKVSRAESRPGNPTDFR